MLRYVPFVFYALLAIGIIYFLVKKQMIKKNGTEADGVISRITSSDSWDDGVCTTTYTYYVQYRHEERGTVEATIMNPKSKLKEGMRVKIKYEPEKPGRAVLMDVVDR